MKEGSLWCQGLFFIIVKASSSTFQRDMSTRQMLATAVLKNSEGLYSTLSGLPENKARLAIFQTQGAIYYLFICFLIGISITMIKNLIDRWGPIMYNLPSASITYVDSMTNIHLHLETFEWKMKGQRSNSSKWKNMFEDFMTTSPCHTWWALEGPKAKFSCYWSNQQNSQQKTFRATLSKHTHHFRGGHSVDEAGPPSSFSALLFFFSLRRSGLSGSWPRTLFWSQTSSAVGSSRRRCISSSDIQRSSNSDGFSAGLS